ncbi:hypothetical protein MRB53_021641 [Persea americana]|uniref:Uncharacterized protein n=1 Tax=Persea americana TaxID=3435 RepID=A0ACC2L5K3_PERAE|nr:hypothetical protein MRB53_021641 [Persea americana]
MPTNPSFSPLSYFQSQSSALYLSYDYPSFPPYVYQVNSVSHFSPWSSTGFLSHRSSEATSPVEFVKQNDLSCQSYDSLQSAVKLSSYEKQLPRHSSGGVTSSNVSSGVAISNKTRIRRTQDLHERFVESVEQLGGAESYVKVGAFGYDTLQIGFGFYRTGCGLLGIIFFILITDICGC